MLRLAPFPRELTTSPPRSKSGPASFHCVVQNGVILRYRLALTSSPVDPCSPVPVPCHCYGMSGVGFSRRNRTCGTSALSGSCEKVMALSSAAYFHLHAGQARLQDIYIILTTPTRVASLLIIYPTSVNILTMQASSPRLASSAQSARRGAAGPS
jgi:hypothetical protein